MPMYLGLLYPRDDKCRDQHRHKLFVDVSLFSRSLQGLYKLSLQYIRCNLWSLFLF